MATSSVRFAAAVAGLLLTPALLIACAQVPDDELTPDRTTARAAAFTACMRDKGYDMPDADADGGLSVPIPDGVDPAQYESDMATCAPSTGARDGVGSGGQPGPDEAFRKAAGCVREHGFEDYPDDPDAIARYQPSDRAAFDDVVETCDAGSSGEVGR